MLAQFQPGDPGIQLELRQPWLRLDGLSIDFYMGVDGLSILMVLLTALVTQMGTLQTAPVLIAATTAYLTMWRVRTLLENRKQSSTP